VTPLFGSRVIRTGVLAGGIGIALLSAALSLSISTQFINPGLAASVWPRNPFALTVLAGQQLDGTPTARQIKTATRLSERAFRLDPLYAPTLRYLGLAQALDQQVDRAMRTYHYSEFVSRRDLPTQMWLIEQAVQSGDIRKALVHYDRAMRTSNQARDVLFPVLIAAAQTPEVAEPLSDTLMQRPNWWYSFVDQMILHTTSADTLPLILRRQHLNPGKDDEARLLASGLHRLAVSGRFSAIRELYQSATGRDVSTLRNGDFEEPNRLPPMDWEIAELDGGNPVQQVDGVHANVALTLPAGRPWIARQLAFLSPGRYQLRAITGGGSETTTKAPMLEIGCAHAGQEDGQVPAIVSMPLARTSEARQVAADVTIPADCTTQWVILRPGVSGSDQGDQSWIDAIRITARN
jgi:hypothetical protein